MAYLAPRLWCEAPSLYVFLKVAHRFLDCDLGTAHAVYQGCLFLKRSPPWGYGAAASYLFQASPVSQQAADWQSVFALAYFLHPVMSSSSSDCTAVSQQAVTCFCFKIQGSIVRPERWRLKAPCREAQQSSSDQVLLSRRTTASQLGTPRGSGRARHVVRQGHSRSVHPIFRCQKQAMRVTLQYVLSSSQRGGWLIR